MIFLKIHGNKHKKFNVDAIIFQQSNKKQTWKFVNVLWANMKEGECLLQLDMLLKFFWELMVISPTCQVNKTEND